MSDFAEWALKLVKELFQPIWDFLTDFLIATLGAIFHAVTALISAIPSCGCFAGGLQAVYGGLHPGIAFVSDQLGIPSVLACIGAAFIFRLGRKIVTLFQW
jgi:hypothetical protein